MDATPKPFDKDEFYDGAYAQAILEKYGLSDVASCFYSAIEMSGDYSTDRLLYELEKRIVERANDR